MSTEEENKVKVSIIMGVYNPKQEGWLRNAVQSIIEQSLTEWELILYDDGSDAVSQEMIRTAADMDERIVLLRGSQNHGLAYALNQCLKRARGKYVARMDADDISLPDRLKVQYEWMEAHPEYAWCGTLCRKFDETGVWGIGRVPEVPGVRNYLYNSPYIHPTVMFRRDVLQKAGGYLVSGVTRRCEDYELFMRLQSLGYQGYNIQKPLFQYREDGAAYQKRAFRYRIDEMRIRFRGFGKMGVLQAATLPYVVKPLLVGLVPSRMHRAIKKRMQREKRVIDL